MKKFFYLLELMLYVMGTIGGFGYCCYSHAYVIAVAVAVLGVMAFPEAKRAFNELQSL